MKLTPAQRSMMVREFPDGRDDFILLHTAGDDKVAKALSNKGLGYFTDQLNVPWGEVMAYLTVITVPVLAFYLALQRVFIASVASTGVK